MERLLALTEGRLRRSWCAVVQHLRGENSPAAIEARLGMPEPVVGIVEAAGKFAADAHAAYVAAGQAAARALSSAPAIAVRKKLLHFDAADPPAVEWAVKNRLDKIRQITEDQRTMIREVLVRMARSGRNPREVARELQASIGLTDYQAGVVARYREDLEAGGARLRAALERELTSGHADKTVLAALRNETAIPPGRIDTMVEQYRANWQRFRAETIARTEGLRVAHQGTEELYRQAIDRGDVDAEQLESEWLHSPRAASRHEREFHRSMHGQRRPYGEPFESGLGNLLRYPGDPDAPIEETAGCRCTKVTRIRRSGVLRRAA